MIGAKDVGPESETIMRHNSQDQSFSCRNQWQDDATGELNGGGDPPVPQQRLRDAGARPPVAVEAEHALVVRGRWRQADE